MRPSEELARREEALRKNYDNLMAFDEIIDYFEYKIMELEERIEKLEKRNKK